MSVWSSSSDPSARAPKPGRDSADLNRAERDALLPEWSRAALPEGLARQSEGVWAPWAHQWSLAEQARITQAASRRAGGSGLHFEHLLRTAVERAMPGLPPEPLLLDLRSGDGSRSVTPWLRVLPRARILASDPASVLLATLVSRAAALGEADRVLGVVADALDAPLAPMSVDVVSGVACLHEMDDPDRVLAAAAAWLRPGGYAVFLAPFDGHGVLRVAYERICAEAGLWPDDPLSLAAETALRTLSADIAARTLPDSSDPAFGELEQKWLFSRESLETAARGLGFREVRFLPHNDHETLYRDMALIQLRTVTGQGDATLPDWALAVLDSFDRALRPPVKRLLMLEGTLVLRR
jgi:SAM-dependent methyltransferase